MLTIKTLRIGPKNHGSPMTEWDFLEAERKPGFKYELIDGKVHVMPYEPDPPEIELEVWLYRALLSYSISRPDVINFVTPKSRVYVPNREGSEERPRAQCGTLSASAIHPRILGA
jgi:hypothetical protein